MDKKKIIREVQFSQDPSRANFDELQQINDKLDKPLKVEVVSDKESIDKSISETIARVLREIKGKKGDKGDKGDKGEAGKDGIDGKDAYTPVGGVDYFDGKDGKDGADGKDGVDGKDGRDGQKGDKGDKGENAKVNIFSIVKEVIKQVKELKGNERIDISNIRNAENIGKKKIDMSDLRWHGGGISTVFAESPIEVPNGIIKDFTAPKVPFFAVFVNGQFMSLTYDYTLSGTTVSFIYAPQTGAPIKFLYV